MAAFFLISILSLLTKETRSTAAGSELVWSLALPWCASCVSLDEAREEGCLEGRPSIVRFNETCDDCDLTLAVKAGGKRQQVTFDFDSEVA